MKLEKVRLYLPVGCLVVALAYSALCYYQNELRIVQIAGAVLTLLGFIFWSISRVQTLRFNEVDFIRTGIYARIAYPLDYFSIVTLVGLGFVLSDIVAYLAIIGIVVFDIVCIRQTENERLKKYGKPYRMYRKTTWL